MAPVVGDLGKAGKYGVKALKAFDKGRDIAKTFNVVRRPISKKGSKTFRIISGGIEKVDDALGAGAKGSAVVNIKKAISKEGLSLDEFNVLRTKDISMLSPKEKGQLKRIRESVPMPDADTIMQKVIPSNDISKYLDGTYNRVGGYVTRADDSKHLKTYNDFYNSLRLDYPQSAFNPFSDDSIGVIRYKTDEISKIKIPYSKEMGGIDVGECPFTGNGFTKAANGEIIPEFRSDGYLEISDGSQLSEIKKDGTEFLRGVYDVNKGKFVSVE